MRTMTWNEIDKDWGGLQKRHRGEIAEAVARYCVGHDVSEVAKQLGYSRAWVNDQLNYAGVSIALGVDNLHPLTGNTGNVAKELPQVIKQFAPTESDAEEFEPYVDHYLEQGHNEPVATRLAKAEWAGEAAVEAGVIQESTTKQGERVNRILFHEDDVDTWTLRFRGHMAAVERAAEFLDSPETKINYLRRKSTCEKVASANAKWLEQVERVCNFHPNLR